MPLSCWIIDHVLITCIFPHFGQQHGFSRYSDWFLHPIGQNINLILLTATFTWSLRGFSYCPFIPATNYCNHNGFTKALKLKYGTQGSKNRKWLDNKLTLHSSTSNVWKSPLVSSLITAIRSFLYSRQRKQGWKHKFQSAHGTCFDNVTGSSPSRELVDWV